MTDLEPHKRLEMPGIELVIPGLLEKERERERDRQTDRQTDTKLYP